MIGNFVGYQIGNFFRMEFLKYDPVICGIGLFLSAVATWGAWALYHDVAGVSVMLAFSINTCLNMYNVCVCMYVLCIEYV